VEFIFVDFPTPRSVNRSDRLFGITGATLACPAGTFRFDLGKPVDYTPASQTVSVRGTLPTRPLRIEFHQAGAAFIDNPAGDVMAPDEARAAALATGPAGAARRARKGSRRSTKRSTKRAAKKAPKKARGK
jgi:hypothetical protein